MNIAHQSVDASDTDFVQTQENLIGGSAGESECNSEQMAELLAHVKNV